MNYLPGPKSTKIVNKMERFCVPSTFAYPLVIKKGDGCYLEDVDGNRYLDFNSMVSTHNVGYNHPKLVEILKESSQRHPYKVPGQDFYNEEAARLAEKLVDITPKKLNKIFFSNSGAEAVENAIKFIYRVFGPLYGVSCERSFHGRTMGALSFTNSKAVQKKNFPEISNTIIKFCVNEEDPEINQFERIISEKGKPAFVLIECIQGEGGYRPASKNFIERLRKVTKENKIPLIVDEIQSGMGRTGKWWAFEHYDIVPEIITSAKSLQVGATISSEKYSPKEKGVVSSTWGGGHRIDLAVGLKMIEIIQEENLLQNAKEMGTLLLKRLDELKEKFPVITDVRGKSLMIGLEFENEKIRDSVELESFKNGLLLLNCGFKSIRIAPPLIIKEKEIGEGISKLEQVLNNLR